MTGVTLAQRYVENRAALPWRWVEEFETLAWRDGETIAFRAEVEQVLLHLLPAVGWVPPWSSVVVLLALTRHPDASGRERVWHRLRTVLTECGAKSELVQRGLDAIELGSRAAALVERLPVADESQPPMLPRVQVLAAVLARVDTDAGDFEVEALCRGLERGLYPATAYGVGRHADQPPRDDLSELVIGIDRVVAGLLALEASAADGSGLDARVATGLHRLPDAVEVDLTEAQRIRMLLIELRDDPELAPLAKLASQCLAALRVPQPQLAPQELSLGGFSDLSNRGPLDRLLPSELAHDDEILAARVAMGEALYLERDRPKVAEAKRRAVLIDVGIRMWGADRVLAAAVALGLGSDSKHSAGSLEELAVYRSTADGLLRIDLTRREGLLELLGSLEVTPSPAAAFAEFRRLHPASPAVETFLITHRQVVSDPDFAPLLSAGELFLVTVDSGRRVELELCHAKGRVELGGATLDVRDCITAVLEGRSPEPNAERRLPAGVTRIPWPPEKTSLLCVIDEERMIAVSKTRCRLLLWDDPQRAPLDLGPVPQGPGWWRRRVERTVDFVIWSAEGGGQLHWLQVDTDSYVVLRRSAKMHRPQSIVHLPGGLVVVHAHAASQSVWLRDDDAFRAVSLPSGRLISERFWRSDWDRVLALEILGRELIHEPLPPMPHGLALIFVFDRPGHDGPWCLFSDRLMRSGADSEIRLVGESESPKPTPNAWLSHDGERLGLLDSRSILDLDTGRVTRAVSRPLLRHLEPVVDRCIRSTWSTYSKLAGMSAVAGELRLWKKAGRRALSLQPLAGDASSADLRWRRVSADDSTGFVAFTGRGHLTSPGGQQAWIDPGGLLRLKGRDHKLEIAIALTVERPCAAWTSTGGRFGAAYFVDDPNLSAAELLALVADFARGWR